MEQRRATRMEMGRWALLIFTAVGLAACPGPSFAQLSKRYELADLKALEAAFVRLADEVRPSVVAIQTYHVRDPRANPEELIRVPVSRGTGFVIDARGYIATNRHVLEDANWFSVILANGLRYEAAVVQADPRSDLAVIKIDAEGLKPIRWGDLVNVKVNQWTFAVGNPFGLANSDGKVSVSFGVVSALGRDMTPQLAGYSPVQYYGNLIETSSTVSPGNSGGPLFNVDGEVIGIVTAIETRSGAHAGAGFAIPVDKYTRRIMDTLKEGKDVRYGFLGVEVRDAAPPSSRRVVHTRAFPGVEVRRISVEDGPAAKAGLKPGDVIIEYDGVPVESSDHLVRLVSFTPVGTDVSITYLRRQVKRKATLTAGDRFGLLGYGDPKE